LAICTLGDANALAAESRVTSDAAITRVQQRLSKENDGRALLGARLRLKFMFGSSLNVFLCFGSADIGSAD
jgi:hypothetical protein